MNELIAYLLKASAGTVILYLCFLFFFRKDTFYFRNRIILILTLILPLVIPLIKISGFAVKRIQPEEVTIGATVINSAITVGETFTNKVNSFDYNGLIITTWMCFAGLLILRMIFGIIKTASIIRKGHVRSDEFPKLIISDIAHPAFSFWPYAVIPRKIFENGDSEDIITHENAHIRQGHTFDLIICELYTSLFWFNPAAWFIKKSVRLNHEFLADQELTRRTADIKNYQYQLLNIPEEFNHLQLAHSFNNLIKNRIVMINRKPTRTYATWKNLLILPVVALIFAAFSFKAVNQVDNNTIAKSEAVKTTPQNTEATNSYSELTDIVTAKPESDQTSKGIQNKADTLKKSTNTISFVPGIGQVFLKVDQMPQFPGGEKEMVKFISDNIKYPPKAKDMWIQGVVIASFIVNNIGKIEGAKIMRSVGSGCDEEALRVINSMPAWTPGKQAGKAVNVSFALPISFALRPQKNVTTGSTLIINIDSLLTSLKNIDEATAPIVLFDYKVIKINEIKKEEIAEIRVLPPNEFIIKAYGEKGKNGEIMITSKQEIQRQTVDGIRAFVVVEQMPQFPGGETAMLQFIKDNLKYPEEAQKNKIQGTIIINFIIDKEGRIRNPKVMRGSGEILDAEALRVLNSMPPWAPGKQGGRAVPVSYTIPVKFVLSDGNSKPDDSSLKVVGYGIQKKPGDGALQKLSVDSLMVSLQNNDSGIKFRDKDGIKEPMVLLDGKVIKISEIKKDEVASISVLKSESAIKAYGEKAKDGAVLITSKQEEQRMTVDGERAYVVVEQMPQFPGGEDAMKQFIKHNLKYPEEAQKQNKQGTIIINFIIDKEGKIRNPKVMRGIVKSLDDEALKVLNLMPAWAPGKQGGKPVAVSYTVPFKFVMN